MPDDSQKRLDAFLSANMQETSRARLQHLIRDGHVAVNGRLASRAGQGIRAGDTVTCKVPPPVPVEAAPEVRRGPIKQIMPPALQKLHARLPSSYAAVTGDVCGSPALHNIVKQGLSAGQGMLSWLEGAHSQHAMQDIPLDVVYEDEHLLVVNKAAGMVVHPAPGNYSGTLVNALLHRFGMPAVRLQLGRSGSEESGLDEAESTGMPAGPATPQRLQQLAGKGLPYCP